MNETTRSRWPVGTLPQADQVPGTYAGLSGVMSPDANVPTAAQQFFSREGSMSGSQDWHPPDGGGCKVRQGRDSEASRTPKGSVRLEK